MVKGIQNKPILASPINAPAIKVQTNPALERTPAKDTVETSKKTKKKMSKGTKWTLGIAGTFLTLAGTGFAIIAHKRYRISQLYKNKLILSDLGENLLFKEASTVEEGIKFAKEVLKIKEVDANISLDAINEANRGLVKVSNANKGKLFMPTAIRYKNKPNENWLASVCRDIESDQFGELNINGAYFEHATLDSILRSRLYYSNGGRGYIQKINSTGIIMPIIDNIGYVPTPETMQLIEKYYTSSATMTIKEKRILYRTFASLENDATFYQRSPITFLKELEAQPKYKAKLENLGIKINYEELATKKTKEQAEYVKNILKKLHNSNSTYFIEFAPVEAETTIYHEIGHLQDYAKNLKKLDLAKYKYSNYRRILKEAWEEAGSSKKDKKKKEQYIGLDEIGNHWGSIASNKDLKKMFDEKPEDFKKCYPDLYEFLTNQETQQTAGKISAYAQSGIGEFIAEVYKEMISGKQIPDDVKALYDKFNGPKLP